MPVIAGLLEILELGLESVVEASLGPSLKFFKFSLEHIVETRVQTGHTEEDSWFDYREVILKLLHIA